MKQTRERSKYTPLSPRWTSIFSVSSFVIAFSSQRGELQALHLARGALGQRGDEAEQARRLVPSELRQTMRAQFRFVATCPRFEDDAGEDVLAVIRIGNADHCGLEYRRMGEQHLVDLARCNILAALDDQLLAPAGDEIKTIVVPIAEIARGKPAIGREHLGGELRVAVIACHHGLTTELDLALLARAEHGAVGGNNARVHPQRRTGGAVFSLFGIEWIGERNRGGLGQPHRLDDRDSKARLERAVLLEWQRRGGRPAEAKRTTRPGLR